MIEYGRKFDPSESDPNVITTAQYIKGFIEDQLIAGDRERRKIGCIRLACKDLDNDMPMPAIMKLIAGTEVIQKINPDAIQKLKTIRKAITHK